MGEGLRRAMKAAKATRIIRGSTPSPKPCERCGDARGVYTRNEVGYSYDPCPSCSGQSGAPDPTSGEQHTDQCRGVGDPMRCYCGPPDARTEDRS